MVNSVFSLLVVKRVDEVVSLGVVTVQAKWASVGGWGICVEMGLGWSSAQDMI